MSQLYVDNIRNRTGGPIGIPTGAVVTGILTATTGNITGNMTVGGVLTYEDVTNIDSVGIITARSGIEFGASGVGGTITATGQAEFAGIITARSGIEFGASGVGGTITATGQAEFAGVCTATSFVGSGSGLTGVAATDNINTSTLAQFTGGVGIADSIFHIGDDNTAIRFPAADTFTVETGGTERFRVTSTGGVHFNNAELIERVNIVANKLSAVPNVNLDNGMVHYYTTNETTTANPNIITTAGINTNMATGDTMSVTIMSKPNNAGYFPRISIDDNLTGITTYWSGGSAPSSAEASGIDVNTYQIIKTADETFDVLANTSNFA